MGEQVECPLAARVPCRKEPPTRRGTRKRGSCSTWTCACRARSRVTQKKTSDRRRRERDVGTEREREKRVGGQLSAGRNFKFEHPLSIKSAPFPSVPCCSYTNFINHTSRHTGGGGYPAGSLCPSYIFAHEIRFLVKHTERPMIGGCNDRYDEWMGGYRDAYK